MYYFKDHLNFSNNLQDNLYILRQRQLKEAAWSPSSGGPAVPESAAGTNELKDRMRNIKQSGDRQQSKEYLEMEAEVNRREGTGSKVNLAKPEGVARTVVQGTEGNERFVRTVQTKDGRYWTDPRDRMSGEELAGRAKEVKMSVPALDIVTYGNKDDVSKLKVTGIPAKSKTTAPATAPASRPYSDRGEGLAKPEANTAVTPENAIHARTFATNNMTGEGQLRQMMGAYGGSNTDMPKGSYSPRPGSDNVSRADPDVQRGQNNGERMFGSGTDADPIRYVPPVDRSKTGTGISDAQRTVTDTAAGAVKDLIRGGSDFIKKQSMNSPGVRYPEVGADPDIQRGQFNTSDPDSPGYDPNANTLDFRQEVKNFSNLFKSPAEFKTGSMNDAGANAGGYGPPSDLNVDASANLNSRDPMAFARYLNSLRQPRFSTIPKSNVGGGGPDIDTQRGQFNINDPDSPGYNPNADMVSPPKPSTEYGTDLVDRLKQVGSETTPDQSSLKNTLQDIIDRMKNNTLPKQPFRPRVSRRTRSR
jgi:hypothetical protein